MAVLILFSAFFSGSEAALFSLTPRGRRRLSRSGAGGRIADGLLADPDRLLSAILFWNLLINMTYFVIAPIVASRLESTENSGQSVALVFSAVSLLTIIFCSEMLPKSVAVLLPVRFSVWVGPPLALAVKIVSPILPVVDLTNQLLRRLIWPTFQREPEIELHDIARAIDLGTDDAALQQRDRIALHGLMEMAEVRASEIMRPRAKLCLCPFPIQSDELAKLNVPGGYVMVTDKDQKTITATIGIRHLRPSQIDNLETAVEDVIYVPWSAHVAQVWDQLDDADVSVAVVVNEFGEVVGAVLVDDVLRRVLAPRRGGDEDLGAGAASIVQLGDQHFRVLGSASLRALAKRLEIESPDETIATAAGFIQRQTERLPRLGDTARLSGYQLTVVEQADEVTWIEVRSFAGMDDTDDAGAPS